MKRCSTWLIIQFNSVAQLCPTLCDTMNRSTPGLPVHHQLPEFTQTHVHGVSDAIQPSHPLSSPSPPASNPSQHQSLFQWVNSSHEVAFFLELFLHWSPVAYWAPTDLGSSSFSVLSFYLFILFMGFSRQEYWSGLPFPSPVDHILSELLTMTHPSWVSLHGIA